MVSFNLSLKQTILSNYVYVNLLLNCWIDANCKTVFLSDIYPLVSSPLGLLGQHQVITTKNDTLNCSEIEFNLEMEEVYCQLASSDNVLLFSPDDIATINYHFYPKYPDLSHPRFIVRTGIGIAISNYVQAFGNISTQNILKEELKRGAHFTIGGQYYINRSLFGVAAEYGHMWFKQSYDSINTWAMERLNNVGVGVAYCSKSVTKELFVTAQLLLTYSDYKTKGKFRLTSFKERTKCLEQIFRQR